MKDTQNELDETGIPIDSAGVSGLKLPMIVKDQQEGSQTVTVDFEIATDLWERRGVHMSRFVDLFEKQYGKVLSLEKVHDLVESVAEAQKARVAYIRANFDYFVPIIAPASGIKSKLPVQVMFECSKQHKPVLKVTTPVMLVCPCSLEISELKQAHNQRAEITLGIQSTDWVWIEELVQFAYSSGSYPVFPLLKREDEKIITDEAHKRPRFVEDAVRRAVDLLTSDDRITWYSVRVESHESIHAHNAFAETYGGEFK